MLTLSASETPEGVSARKQTPVYYKCDYNKIELKSNTDIVLYVSPVVELISVDIFLIG